LNQQFEQRLTDLRAEYRLGQKALAELENKQTAFRNTLLRIKSAIQVIEEELTKENIKEKNKETVN
jgi:hypothetical protein